MAEFCYKVYRVDNDVLLAICDADIVGKVFTERELVLDAKKSFYHKQECGPIKAKRLFEEATIINATGERVVQLLVDVGLVDPNKVLRVSDVPHAQMVRIAEPTPLNISVELRKGIE